MPGRSGGRPKGRKDSPDVVRHRRSRAEMTAAEMGSTQIAVNTLAAAEKGDANAVQIVNDILNGRGWKHFAIEYPLDINVAMRLLGLAAPYQSPRLQSVTVTDESDDQQARRAQLEKLHKAALEHNKAAENRYPEAQAVIEKLSESDAAVLRKALGIVTATVIEGEAQ